MSDKDHFDMWKDEPNPTLVIRDTEGWSNDLYECKTCRAITFSPALHAVWHDKEADRD